MVNLKVSVHKLFSNIIQTEIIHLRYTGKNSKTAKPTQTFNYRILRKTQYSTEICFIPKDFAPSSFSEEIWGEKACLTKLY